MISVACKQSELDFHERLQDGHSRDWACAWTIIGLFQSRKEEFHNVLVDPILDVVIHIVLLLQGKLTPSVLAFFIHFGRNVNLSRNQILQDDSGVNVARLCLTGARVGLGRCRRSAICSR